LRICLDELFQHRRKLVKPDRINCGNPHLAADDVAQTLHLFGQCVEALDDLSTAFIKGQPGRCRDYGPAAAALEEPSIESVFERANLLADRRLRDEVARGSL